MKRITIIASLAASLLAIALVPTIASAERHHSHHRHHRGTQSRLEHFGTSNPAAPASGDAGTITSFTGGVLMIKLTDGSSVTGKVTSATELKCESASPAITARAADHGDGGDRGSGGDVGDDNGQDLGDISEHSGEGSDEDSAEGSDDNSAASCQMTDLSPGTAVRHAELRVGSGSASFSEVEIVR
jgi:hypothetical protein